MNAPINEIFASIQGEGKFAGASQIFIRFAGCPLHCFYCDTDYTPKKYLTIGAKSYINPISCSELKELLRGFEPEKYHSVSFTGGEPLLYTEFIIDAAFTLKSWGAKSFLETSGRCIVELERAAPAFDYISLDLKGAESYSDDIYKGWRSLVKAASNFRDKLYFKLVLRGDSADELGYKAVQAAGELLKSFGFCELWLQPIDNRFNLATILDWQRILKNEGVDGRFLPQIHKLLGIN
ncbi:MAG: 7-carboxy-7-deazaguanine synthase QueE [Deferribacteraceae bacterium]|jgi:organic radical activating enzyme|nr:7-carboxy-7-deazaguanine synthase QueE [Deferribacteraceae bacterium]